MLRQILLGRRHVPAYGRHVRWRRAAAVSRLRARDRAYIGENEPIAPPLVFPEGLPVIVLFPRVSNVPVPTRCTPKSPLFANTQFE